MNRKEAILLSRELRKNQTAAEGIIWEIVRNRRLLGLKFIRQHPIEYSSHKYFIVDFYCHQLQLVLEIDGEIHQYQKSYDQGRENILIDLGYKILRYSNHDVFNKKTKVIDQLKIEVGLFLDK